MSIRESIKTYEDVFSKEIVDKIQLDIASAKWQFGHKSQTRGRGYPFWIIDGLKHDPYYTEYLLNIIQEKTQQEYIISDVYANGQTFGQQGSLHTDCHDQFGRTFLYYANVMWSPDYAGKTVFVVDNDEMHYQNPVPNSAVLFPGKIRHMSEGVSRLFTGLRVTIAWKLVLK